MFNNSRNSKYDLLKRLLSEFSAWRYRLTFDVGRISDSFELPLGGLDSNVEWLLFTRGLLD
jgi:hypothetical protein